MTKNTRYIGLDVHGETITAAVAVGRTPPESSASSRTRRKQVRKFLEKLGDRRELKVCYEAGPTGYALYFQLKNVELGDPLPRPDRSRARLGRQGSGRSTPTGPGMRVRSGSQQ